MWIYCFLGFNFPLYQSSTRSCIHESTHAKLSNFQMSDPEFQLIKSYQEETFKACLEQFYLSKSQEIIQTMINSLVGPIHWYDSIVTVVRAQTLQTFRISVPDLTFIISFQDEVFKTSLGRLYPTKSQEHIQNMPNSLFRICAKLQLSKLQT